MKKLTFRNNDQMPAFGMGTWNSAPGEVYKAVKTAIQQGYRHIDCAKIYGNEKEIGQALADCFSEGIVSRGDLWVTSKLWNNSHVKELVLPALKQTLSDLQLDYLDLYLIHWPVALRKDILYPQSVEHMVSLEKIPIAHTWAGMEKMVSMGLTRHIGVSNFGIKRLQNLLLNCSIQPEMNQVEAHPYLQQEELLTFCRANSIHFTAYCPLGSSNRPERLKTKNEPVLLRDPIVGAIAASKNVTPAQVLISWALHRGISVIPKSVNPERIAQNLAAEQIHLTQEEMYRISTLNKNHRYISGSTWVFEDGPYTMEGIFG